MVWFARLLGGVEVVARDRAGTAADCLRGGESVVWWRRAGCQRSHCAERGTSRIGDRDLVIAHIVQLGVGQSQVGCGRARNIGAVEQLEAVLVPLVVQCPGTRGDYSETNRIADRHNPADRLGSDRRSGWNAHTPAFSTRTRRINGGDFTGRKITVVE